MIQTPIRQIRVHKTQVDTVRVRAKDASSSDLEFASNRDNEDALINPLFSLALKATTITENFKALNGDHEY